MKTKFMPEVVAYYETLATACIRRLWLQRADPLARKSIRGWVGTLRDVARCKAA